MTVRSTSLEAYEQIKPKLSKSQQRVLLAIYELGQATNRQIAKHLDLEINQITPRTLELREMGKVEEHDTIVQNGRKAYRWRFKEEDKGQMEMEL